MPFSRLILILVVLECAMGAPWDKIFDLMDEDSNGIASHQEIIKFACSMEGHEGDCVKPGDKKINRTMAFYGATGEGLAKTKFLEKLNRNAPGDPIEGGPQQIHLSLTDNPHEMVVMWITRDKTLSFVRYGKTEALGTESAAGVVYTYAAGEFGWSGWIHRVTLENLEANTRYFYVVGYDGDWSDTFDFRTAPNITSGVKYSQNTFAIVADMGTAIPMGWAVTDQIVDDYKSGTDFGIIWHVGDVAYAGTGSTWEFEEIWDAWEDQVQPLAAHVPYMFAVGNHEKYFNYTSYRSRFQMPGEQSNGNGNLWHSFDYGNVHFCCMSTEHDYAPGSIQGDWIARDLELARKSEDTDWIILGGHRPMYSSDKSEWNSHKPGSRLQLQIEPLLVKYEVDLWLCGHMHMYERIHPVLNGTVLQTGNVYRKNEAPPQVVQGTAGVFTDTEFVVPRPTWSATRNDFWGYAKMEVNATHLHYVFLREEDGSVADEFWIAK